MCRSDASRKLLRLDLFSDYTGQTGVGLPVVAIKMENWVEIGGAGGWSGGLADERSEIYQLTTANCFVIETKCECDAPD